MTLRRRATIIGGGSVGAVALMIVWVWTQIDPSPLSLGRAAYDRRDWSTAAHRAFDALKEQPTDLEALRLLAWSSGRMGRDDSARSIYKQLGLDSLGPEDCLIIAAGFQRQGDLGSALRFLEKGHDLNPNHSDILHDLSRYFASMNRLKQAEGLASRLAAQAGQGPRGSVLLGAIRDRLSDPAGAAEALERALRLDPSLKDLDPGPVTARKLLARNYLRAGESSKALDHLRRVLDEGPRPRSVLAPEPSVASGRTSRRGGRRVEAGQQLLGRSPNRPGALASRRFVRVRRMSRCDLPGPAVDPPRADLLDRGGNWPGCRCPSAS